MSKKIFNLYGMNMFLSGLPYYFVGILLLKHLGFSFTEIATLSVITELCGSVFDIPLSYISSKIGYKKILVISNLLLILALWGLLFGKSNIIYISAIFFGLSESLSSGVLNSYNFEIIDDEVVYKSFLKNLNTLKYIFIAIVTIISPPLLHRNYIYPVVISIIFVIFSLLYLIGLPEIKKEQNNNQKFFSLDNIQNIPWFLIISMALGSYLKIKFEVSLMLPILAILMFFQTNLIIQIIILLLMRVLNSNYNNHFYYKFNMLIEKNRAVLWSVYNLFISISFMLADFLAGIFADNFSIRSNYLIFGIVALCCLVSYSFSNRDKRT